MSSPTGRPDDDGFWQRPAAGGAGTPGEASHRPPGEPTPPAYAGPPPSTPPPPGWRPPLVVQPPPPRRLPPQDEQSLDEAERSARTVTYGIGMVAGAVLLVVVCVLCSRVLF